MGWETRKGGTYYYAKERTGARVVSRYIGAGELVHFVETMETERREEKELNREAWRLERGQMRREEERATEIFAAADELMEAALLAAGFHKHKREWRRKRCRKSTR